MKATAWEGGRVNGGKGVDWREVRVFPRYDNDCVCVCGLAVRRVFGEWP